ncbi:MAG: GxxExxY protein [Lentisphaeria bacterium]|jgi:GxxExxY protein
MLIYQKESYRIIGACMEVHAELGPGFLEPVYQEALAVVLTEKGVPFAREKELPIFFRGKALAKRYIADFVCFDTIIVELKALDCLAGEHEAQVLNYLKATRFKLGLLVNFGTTSLQQKRLVL